MEHGRGVIEKLKQFVARKPRWRFCKLYYRLRLDGQSIGQVPPLRFVPRPSTARESLNGVLDVESYVI
jgi:hypothetical protein